MIRQSFNADVKKAENGLAKDEQKVKNTYRKDGGKGKAGFCKG